jgi:hypothetical protein
MSAPTGISANISGAGAHITATQSSPASPLSLLGCEYSLNNGADWTVVPASAGTSVDFNIGPIKGGSYYLKLRSLVRDTALRYGVSPESKSLLLTIQSTIPDPPDFYVVDIPILNGEDELIGFNYTFLFPPPTTTNGVTIVGYEFRHRSEPSNIISTNFLFTLENAEYNYDDKLPISGSTATAAYQGLLIDRCAHVGALNFNNPKPEAWTTYFSRPNNLDDWYRLPPGHPLGDLEYPQYPSWRFGCYSEENIYLGRQVPTGFFTIFAGWTEAVTYATQSNQDSSYGGFFQARAINQLGERSEWSRYTMYRTATTENY